MSEDLIAAAKAYDRLRAEVLAWMDAEGRAGRFRQNDQAPMWFDYKDAEKALDTAVAAVGT